MTKKNSDGVQSKEDKEGVLKYLFEYKHPALHPNGKYVW